MADPTPTDPVEIFARAFDAAIDAYLQKPREVLMAEPEPDFPGEGIMPEVAAGFGALRSAGWQLVKVADSWAGDNGGHCILADEVWRG